MTEDLDLPPPYRGVTLREQHDAFAHALAVADEAGAGTLVCVRRFDTAEAAVVLEPEEPLAGTRRAVYAVMNALGDALAMHCPPERPLTFEWPDMVLFDGGIIGGVRLGWPAACAENEVPRWLVGGLMLRTAMPTRRDPTARPGAHPLDVTHVRGTSLDIEGFEMLDSVRLVSSFARHLMVQFDHWQEEGFDEVGRQFLSRLGTSPRGRRGIDVNGDLLEHVELTVAGAHRRSLIEALATPQWLDPDTQEPWL